jgi:hypothetical protein
MDLVFKFQDWLRPHRPETKIISEKSGKGQAIHDKSHRNGQAPDSSRKIRPTARAQKTNFLICLAIYISVLEQHSNQLK